MNIHTPVAMIISAGGRPVEDQQQSTAPLDSHDPMYDSDHEFTQRGSRAPRRQSN